MHNPYVCCSLITTEEGENDFWWSSLLHILGLWQYQRKCCAFRELLRVCMTMSSLVFSDITQTELSSFLIPSVTLNFRIWVLFPCHGPSSSLFSPNNFHYAWHSDQNISVDKMNNRVNMFCLVPVLL